MLTAISPVDPEDDSPHRSGFTLVEILVVIVIIGILASLSVAAITTVLPRARQASISGELATLADGIDRYKQKYGDYPPDFSDWNVVERHYRKIFPDIASTELVLLYRLCDTESDNPSNANQLDGTRDPFNATQMDRAEALVWSLGGFSTDPQFPFTGPGGPLAPIPGTSPVGNEPGLFQYNIDRQNALADFQIERLTLSTIENPAAGINFNNRVQSSDETSGLSGSLPDLFPVYLPRDESTAPFVYFDSRTYTLAVGGSRNGYACFVDGDRDNVRPLYSQIVNGNQVIPASNSASYASQSQALRAFEPMNARTFQILCPGLDGRFGIVADANGGEDPTDSAPLYWMYPEGKAFVPFFGGSYDSPDDLVQTVDAYNSTSLPSGSLDAFEKDNLASFSDGSFEDDLP